MSGETDGPFSLSPSPPRRSSSAGRGFDDADDDDADEEAPRSKGLLLFRCSLRFCAAPEARRDASVVVFFAVKKKEKKKKEEEEEEEVGTVFPPLLSAPAAVDSRHHQREKNKTFSLYCSLLATSLLLVLGNLAPCDAWEEAPRRPAPAAATGTSRRWQPRASSTATGSRPGGPCAPPSATAGAAVSPAGWAREVRGDPWTRSRRRGRARGELIGGGKGKERESEKARSPPLAMERRFSFWSSPRVSVFVFSSACARGDAQFHVLEGVWLLFYGKSGRTNERRREEAEKKSSSSLSSLSMLTPIPVPAPPSLSPLSFSSFSAHTTHAHVQLHPRLQPPADQDAALPCLGRVAV